MQDYESLKNIIYLMTAPGSSPINFLKLSVITVLQIKEVTHSLVDTSTTYSLQNISK